MSLADMGFATSRVGGGIGFALDRPELIVEVAHADQFAMIGFDDLDCSGRKDAFEVLSKLKNIIYSEQAFTVRLVSCPPQHVGFGSKTALALALAEGVNHLYHLGIDRKSAQRLSGRGGLSGVGIHTFFTGGVICDNGHPRPVEVAAPHEILPSNLVRPNAVPSILARYEFPKCWKVGLMLEPASSGKAGEEERKFFVKNSPIPPNEALRTLAIIKDALLPSFRDHNLSRLGAGLQELHRTGFKAAELRAAGPVPNQLFTALNQSPPIPFAAGLSSVGPLIYAIYAQEDSSGASRWLKSVGDEHGVTVTLDLSGWNSGYEVEYLARGKR